MAHSLGGLVCLEYSHSPNGLGLSVYSTHDNIVHPPTTCELNARGGSDVAVDGLGHLSLLYSPDVTRVLIEIIEQDEQNTTS